MPQHRRVLGRRSKRSRHGDDNDYGRHLHEGMQVLFGEDGKESPAVGPRGAGQHRPSRGRMGIGLRGVDLRGQRRWVWGEVFLLTNLSLNIYKVYNVYFHRWLFIFNCALRDWFICSFIIHINSSHSSNRPSRLWIESFCRNHQRNKREVMERGCLSEDCLPLV